MTVQLLGKEDQISDEAISSEEKWSQYVDQFVQLSSTENALGERREPFLKRSLPTHVGEEPPLNVETKSGLELKICVNTYKIFFVDNTEDYFRRKRQSSSSTLGLKTDHEASISLSKKRTLKFHEWLNSDRGWKAGLSPEAIKANLATYEKLKK